MWTIIGFVIAGLWIVGSIIDYVKKKNSESNTEDDDEFSENLLPPLSEDTKLDYNIHRVLSSNGLPGMDREYSVARKYIRDMIVGEILLRVSASSINPETLEIRDEYAMSLAKKTFDREIEQHRQLLQERTSKVEVIREIMNENGISEEWLLSNGEFKAKPYGKPHLIVPDSAAMIIRARELEEYSKDSIFTYKHHGFGNALPYSNFDEISDKELNLMIQFKDRLIAKFLESVDGSYPRQFPKTQDLWDKYRPK